MGVPASWNELVRVVAGLLLPCWRMNGKQIPFNGFSSMPAGVPRERSRGDLLSTHVQNAVLEPLGALCCVHSLPLENPLDINRYCAPCVIELWFKSFFVRNGGVFYFWMKPLSHAYDQLTSSACWMVDPFCRWCAGGRLGLRTGRKNIYLGSLAMSYYTGGDPGVMGWI
jgi:hypothetical protein